MSFENYTLSMEKAQECDCYEAGDGVSKDYLKKAESLLGITFSKQFSDYLLNYGCIDFYGVELYGIVNEKLSYDVIEGKLIEWTLTEREKNGLDLSWIPIRFEDDGAMAFLDFSCVNADNEPKVISAILTDDGYVKQFDLADDFGDYVLDLVDEQIENQ